VNRDEVRVRRHFHHSALDFDAIYTGKKSPIGRLFDRLLRWDMQERLKLTLEACEPLQGKSVLDVGCGTGRFCFPLAEKGAERVVGVDFAEAMITGARSLAEQKNLADKCRFECVDIMRFEAEQPFDYVIAVGLFDYIKDARRLMHKLRKLTRIKAIMTFPRADTWRAPLRKVRLTVMGCPVYFYTERRVRDHLMITGFSVSNLHKVGKLYFVEAT